MKSTFKGLTLTLGLSTPLIALAEEALTTDKAKISYSIGQQIGQNMKSQGIEIDPKVLAESIGEALAGKTSRLNEAQIKAAMTTLQKNVQEKRESEAKTNLDAGEKFLATNKKTKGVVTTASGLQYEVVTSGKGALPKDDSVVKVHYKGTLLDGQEFDNSYKRNQPAEFGVNGVIPGWTEALKMMPVGSKWKLTIPAKLAYGPTGRPGIPPNSVLKFDVELLDIVKSPTAKK